MKTRVGAMQGDWKAEGLPAVSRIPTSVPGLDAVLGGGLPAGRTCLVAGPPGTGKTTLGNHIGFKHAAAGGSVVFVTMLTETHDVMLQNLKDFSFFDRTIPGDRIRYFSVLQSLQQDGLEGVVQSIRRAIREASATLLVVDGTAVAEDMAPATFDVRRFAQQLETQSSMLGCTAVLLTSHGPEEMRTLGAHVNGVVVLSNERNHSRNVRMLEVTKLRGARHAGGVHEFDITKAGVAVYPRLESLIGRVRPKQDSIGGLGVGSEDLDTMLGGGLMRFTNTLVLGTPGSGKTVLGLSFIEEGASRGEPGLIVGFHETEADLRATSAGIGLDLGRHIEEGTVRVLWDPPLEISVDEWAWRLLSEVEAHQSRRVFIDGLTDIQRLITTQQRLPAFISALANELRARGATTLVAAEIDAYVDTHLAAPIPNVSATMDNGILLRHVEVRSELRRLISVLKARQAATDPTIREFTIGEQGLVVSRPFAVISGLLTGRASSSDPAILDS